MNTIFGRRGLGFLTIIIAGVIFFRSAYFVVNPGERGIVIRLGQLQERIYDSGIHFKIPIIDSTRIMNVQTKVIQSDASSASKDQQTVEVALALNYRLDPANVAKIYQNIGTNDVVETTIIKPAIQDSVKGSTALFTAEQLITKRKEVSDAIAASLKSRLERQGIIVIDVNIVNYSFSEDFNKAIENKVRAEQEALAEKNRLEKTKYEAQQSIERAKAIAESIKIQAEAVKAQGGSEYVRLQWIEKRDGKLPSTMLGDGKDILLNIDTQQQTQ